MSSTLFARFSKRSLADKEGFSKKHGSITPGLEQSCLAEEVEARLIV